MLFISVVAASTIIENCNHIWAYILCTPILSQANLKAERKLRREVGSNGSSSCEFICTSTLFDHLALLHQSCIRSEIDWLPARHYVLCPLFHESGLWQCELPNVLHYGGAASSQGSQMTNHSPAPSVRPYRDGHAAYASIICHPQTLFPSASFISLRLILTKTNSF